MIPMKNVLALPLYDDTETLFLVSCIMLTVGVANGDIAAVRAPTASHTIDEAINALRLVIANDSDIANRLVHRVLLLDTASKGL